MPRRAAPAPFVLKDNTVPNAICEYAGYAGLFAAHGGLEPSENSVFFKNGGFKVKLSISEDESWGDLNPAEQVELDVGVVGEDPPLDHVSGHAAVQPQHVVARLDTDMLGQRYLHKTHWFIGFLSLYSALPLVSQWSGPPAQPARAGSGLIRRISRARAARRRSRQEREVG